VKKLYSALWQVYTLCMYLHTSPSVVVLSGLTNGAEGAVAQGVQTVSPKYIDLPNAKVWQRLLNQPFK